MSGLKRFFDSPITNWAMTGISVFMISVYVARAKAPNPDPDAMYLAIAWAFMLGIWLLSAIYKTWGRKKS
jgi:hypothetical protein